MATPQLTYLFGAQVPNALFVRGLLTPTETNQLVRECRGHPMAHVKIDGYDPAYRNNERAIIKDLSIHQELFERLRPYLPATVAELNPWWRFCRYEAGGIFGKHTDRPNNYTKEIDGVPRQLHSRWTVMLYLTSGSTSAVPQFEGGETRFYRRGVTDFADVSGEAGSCVMFDQRYLHEGLVVRAVEATGVAEKLILRSDAMVLV